MVSNLNNIIPFECVTSDFAMRTPSAERASLLEQVALDFLHFAMYGSPRTSSDAE